MHIRQNFRIYPSKEQQTTLTQWFGQARFIWNLMLSKNIEKYDQEKKFIFSYDMHKALTVLKHDMVWLREIPLQALQQKCIDLDKAMKRSFKKISGFPKFKSRHADQSGIRFQQRWQIKGNRINLPKMKGVKINLHQPLQGKTSSVTIFKDKCGDYWVSILVEVLDVPQKQEIESVVGIDLGVRTLLTLSDGTTIQNPKLNKNNSKKTKRLQQSLSRKQKDSRNKEKARRKLARHHRKVANQRKDYINKVAHSIAKKYDLVVMESLDVQSMLQEKLMSDQIADASMSLTKTAIQWQVKKQGKHIHFIDRWYPSSKTCSCCGNIDKNLKRCDTLFVCPKCGHEMDRDLNASINILQRGLNDFNTAGTTEIEACQIQVDDVDLLGTGSYIL